ncbi:MAG: FliA/WhiG family RNA polymerase sigma factor [Deltaproteobacteria bacterium]|nr:MAG: FliA/WhiG family RNA polymerase sigma factor [Deltaproteobacteria bacterium]
MESQRTALNLPFEKTAFHANGKLSEEEKEEFIVKYGGLVKYMAHRLAARLPKHVAVDDLISAGMIGFIDALDKFDPSREVKFRTYMEIRVRGAMLDELRTLDPVPRSTRQKAQELSDTYNELEKTLNRPPTDEEIAEKLGISIDEFYRILDQTKAVSILPLEYADFENVEDEKRFSPPPYVSTDSSNPLEQLEQKELENQLVKAIEHLPDKEKLVISLYYYDQLTMKEIGQILNVSESRVSQIHSRAMLRLRNALNQNN